MRKASANAIPCNENRRSPRYRTDQLITIEFQNRKVTGTCVDYNENGFGAIINGELPVGEIMSVEFSRLNQEAMRLQVRTIYQRGARYGFEFIAPADKRRTIADFFKESLEENKNRGLSIVANAPEPMNGIRKSIWWCVKSPKFEINIWGDALYTPISNFSVEKNSGVFCEGWFCHAPFGHLVKAGACIFCDWIP